MSSSGLTIAAPPTIAESASDMLGAMAALSGVLTDYNPGSQIRTFSEAAGAVTEQQGIWSEATAFQALVYGIMTAFGLTQGLAKASTGVVTFATGTGGSPPPSTINVPIPAGTIVQTSGGTQFATLAATILAAGGSSVNVNVAALVAGAAGNVQAGAINTRVSGLIYPLVVSNAAATTGGQDAQSPADAMQEVTDVVASIGLSSPVAIANAAFGVQASGSAETVLYACCYEPWAVAGSGMGSGTAGYQVILDNGAGTASSGLINAVTLKLNGGAISGVAIPGSANGFRDAGVPYSVIAVTPVPAVVAVTGVVNSLGNFSVVSGAIADAVSGYFTLQFGKSAEQGQIAAAVANATDGQLSSLTVSLYASGSASGIALLTPPVSGRVILGSLTISSGY